MKKIYTIVALSVISCGISLAQSASSGAHFSSGKKVGHTLKLDPHRNYRFQNTHTADRTAVTGWVSYAEGKNILNSGTSVLNQNYLINDSTVIAAFGADWASPFVHQLGQVFDAKSSTIRDAYNMNLDKTIAYTLDSMAILYAYNRVTADSIVDTLIVSMYTDATASNLGSYYFNDVPPSTTNHDDYGADTVYFKGQKYSYVTNKAVASGMVTLKLPLTASDTTTSVFLEKAFNTSSFSVPANKLLAVAVTYKPGMAYSLSDTLDRQVNSFTFGSYEENGTGTFPSYTYCRSNNAFPCDGNVSSVVTSDVRYNLDANWNGLFIPSYAFTAPYTFEQHVFTYKITAASQTSVNEIGNTDFTLTQNQPNPFTETTTINYQLSKPANKVALSIFDVRGVKVYESSESNQKSGSYSVDLNAKFTPGVYFYSLTVDGARITKKMIAQ